MKRISRVLALAGLVAVAACSAGGTGGPAITSNNPTSPNYSSLQLAVGNATIATSATTQSVGLNVVSTFRQTNGASATGVNTPTITGPFTFTIGAVPGPNPAAPPADPYSTVILSPPGPSLSETSGTPAISGTLQTVNPGTPNCDGNNPPAGFINCQNGIAPNDTTFGQSGGVFAMGLAPYNSVAATGQSYSYAPYAQPMYDASQLPSGGPPTVGNISFIPWGGPPAFDPNGDGLGERDGKSFNNTDSFGDPYFLGVGEGITVFDGVSAGGGTYTLSVAVQTVGNGGAVTTSTVKATASLNAATKLPVVTAPVFTPDGNGDGGGTFTATLPAGATEGYVQIVDYGPGGGPADGAASKSPNCQGPRGTQFAPVYYTFEIVPGTTNYTLAPTIGPSTSTTGGVGALSPSPSVCTLAQNQSALGNTTSNGDDIVVQFIAFDYPAYEAAVGLTKSGTPQNPPLTAGAGQADITISQPVEQDNGGTGTPTPISIHRNPQRAPLPRSIRH